jgi:hypothetical protein
LSPEAAVDKAAACTAVSDFDAAPAVSAATGLAVSASAICNDSAEAWPDTSRADTADVATIAPGNGTVIAPVTAAIVDTKTAGFLTNSRILPFNFTDSSSVN